jgi:cytochrome c oxidase subunit II
MSQGRHALLAVLAWAVLSAIGIFLVVGVQIMPQIASHEAEIENGAFVLLTAVSVPVLMFVVVGMVYSAIYFRAGSDMADGPPVHGNSRIQAGWLIVTTAMVIALFVYGTIGLIEIRGAQESTFEVEVHAKQWAWEFDYDNAGFASDELHIPVDQRVHLIINSNDAIHSLWLPALGVKQDAVPGRQTEAYVTATDTGTYGLMCAELCGFGHTIMTSTVTVSTQADLDAWMQQQREAASP